MNSRTMLFRILLLGVLVGFPMAAAGQIYGYQNSVDYSTNTGYGEDTIFVFHAGNASKAIAATHTTGDTSRFLWKRFNPATYRFDSLMSEGQVEASRIDLGGLYQQGDLTNQVEALEVEVTGEGLTRQTYRAWIVVDTLNDFEITEYRNTCNQIKLELENFLLPDYPYIDLSALPGDTVQMTLKNELSEFQWQASANVDIYWPETPLYEGQRVLGYIGSPLQMPYEDSDYYLNLTNRFGNSASDTIYEVVAKAVKADFNVDKLTPDGARVDYSQRDVNEALLQVLFENQSKNADRYHWVGFNDSLNILRGRDSILWQSEAQTPVESEIPSYRPGKYPVRLKVENDYGCQDSTTYYHIQVDSSRIDSTLIPNVFTPDGNNINDVFVLPKASNLTGGGKRGLVSMKWIEVSVFNRSGELVYRYNGDPLDWEGWRGKVRNGNRDAAEGVYLYVIKGRGYDGVMHENKQYSGFLYLFRE